MSKKIMIFVVVLLIALGVLILLDSDREPENSLPEGENLPDGQNRIIEENNQTKPVELDAELDEIIVNPPPSVSAPPPPAGGETAVIKMIAGAFSPREIEIEKGAQVTFVNSDIEGRWPASNIHPTHQIYPEFDPQKIIRPGESWSFTFDEAGIFRYHDHLFPNLTGTITVK